MELRVSQSGTIPKPSTSGTTPAQVTIARSRLSKEGAQLATPQPKRKCVIGLINFGRQNTCVEPAVQTSSMANRSLPPSVWGRRMKVRSNTSQGGFNSYERNIHPLKNHNPQDLESSQR